MGTEQTIKQSRVGKEPVALPAGVEVKVDGQHVTVKGPQGTLERTFSESVKVEVRDGLVEFVISKGDRQSRAYQGLTRALVQNMVTGVATGFSRMLEVNGVGYRAELKGGTEILFHLGYSHPILYELPHGVKAEVAKDNKITLWSISKEQLGHAAAKIRSFRAPEPYKGKGVKYAEETIRRKAGKAAAR